jgi:hypothetical protein
MTTLSGTAQPAPAAGLARHLRGPVIEPDSPGWDAARRPHRAVVDAQRKGVDDIERARLARQGAFFEQLTIADLLQVATTTNQE